MHKMQRVNFCYKQLLSNCGRVPVTFKMDPAIFMTKLFETDVSSFIIVTKNSILDVAGIIMRNEDLTCSEAESYNAPFYAILLFISLNVGKFCHLPAFRLSLQELHQQMELRFI